MDFAVRLGFGRWAVLTFVMALTACGGDSTSSTSQDHAAEHLYATNTAGQILKFPLPLTSGSRPSVVVSNHPFNAAIAVDANGTIATSDRAGHLAIYNQPLTSSSAPAAIFNNDTPATNDATQYLAFSTAGDLFAMTGNFATVGQINLFAHPLSSASTVSQVITNPSVTTAFDLS